MRETLYQLTVALALPIAVGAIGVGRGNSVGNPVWETATAYRVELAELPLPTRERLRSPGVATDLRVARVIPEDTTPRGRRPLLPNLTAPPPVGLAVDASSGVEIVAPPSPRVVPEPQGAVALAPHFPLRAAPALGAIAPPAVSRRNASVAASDGAKLPAVSAAPTPTGKATAKETAAAASLRDLGLIRSRGTEVYLERARILAKSSPIATGPREIGASPREKFVNADGYSPLTPAGPFADRAGDYSLTLDEQKPSLPTADLPLLPLERHAEPSALDSKLALAESTPIFVWRATLSPTLVMIPEPGSALLLGAALAALGAGRRGRRRA